VAVEVDERPTRRHGRPSVSRVDGRPDIPSGLSTAEPSTSLVYHKPGRRRARTSRSNVGSALHGRLRLCTTTSENPVARAGLSSGGWSGQLACPDREATRGLRSTPVGMKGLALELGPRPGEERRGQGTRNGRTVAVPAA
jgi:hypothetical protein